MSLEEDVEGSSGLDHGYEGKTERLDLEKIKDKGEREVESAEESDFGKGEKGKGSKESASGDEGQVSRVCPLPHMKTVCPSL